jgi:hypothetical protein
MRKFLGTLVIVALIVAVLGLYRGWFGVSTDDQPGDTNIEITIDKDKIKQDAEAAAEKAHEFASDLNDQNDDQNNDRSDESAQEEDAPAAE